MLWDFISSIVLFWFSSISFIFIVMLSLFGVSYLYDYWVWSRRSPSVISPPVQNAAMDKGCLYKEGVNTENVKMVTVKKGAKWKKTSKKKAEKLEKEIYATDYDSTSSESYYTVSSKSTHQGQINTVSKEKLDLEVPLTYVSVSKENVVETKSLEKSNKIESAVLDRAYKIFSLHDDSDDSLSDTDIYKTSLTSKNENDDNSCIPISAQHPESATEDSYTVSEFGSKNNEYTATAVPTKVAMFSSSPGIALTGPGPGSFVAHRAEPTITPFAYIDPPIYGNIMPLFHVDKLTHQETDVTNESKTKDIPSKLPEISDANNNSKVMNSSASE